MQEDLIYGEKDGRIVEFSQFVWDNMPNDKYGFTEVKKEVPAAVKDAIKKAEEVKKN